MTNYTSFYKKAAQCYNQSRLDEKTVFEDTLSIIATRVKENASSIIDLGCGTGEYTYALSELGFDVTGLDSSLEQVEIARTKISTVEVGDIRDLKFNDSSFDVALLIMVLHQLPKKDLRRSFSEINRILKNNGLLIIKTCFENDIDNRFTSRFFPECRNLDLQRFPSKKDIEKAISKTQLLIIDTFQYNMTLALEKEVLINKLEKRGASNLGLIDDESFLRGINRIKSEYINTSIIRLTFDNTFIVLKKCS